MLLKKDMKNLQLQGSKRIKKRSKRIKKLSKRIKNKSKELLKKLIH